MCKYHLPPSLPLTMGGSQYELISIGRQGKKHYARQQMASSEMLLTRGRPWGEIFMGMKIHDYRISIASP